MKNTKWITQLVIFIVTVFIVGNSQRMLPDDPPKVMIDGAELTLLASEPDIKTPTGVQVDDQNRIWVIENHTHVRQDDYPGPKVDRILVFEGYIDSSEEKKVTEFATDFTDGMSLSFTRGGKVLVTTRASIIEFTDDDGDNVADSRKTLISLETEEKFPHNGMSGLTISPDGKMYFQCGENFGASYVITGSDGINFIGKEREGGSLYRSDVDGSNLERISTAIWNCFAMTFDPFGNIFAVENDPDSRPPCRLLHVVKGGNYGFQFQHGRDGLSPLTSWFGQLPGTLPMVAGVGEAPSGVLHYNLDRLGDSNNGALLVTAWGDNEIQSFKLNEKGSSFVAEKNTIVKGSRDFYPVGLAQDSRGGVITTDWASVSYAVHGKGRIWRLANPKNDEKLSSLEQFKKPSRTDLINLLNSPDLKIRAEAADYIFSMKRPKSLDYFNAGDLGDYGKINLIWAAQASNHESLKDLLFQGLSEKNSQLRAAVVRTMVDERMIQGEQFFIELIEKETSPYVIREAIYGLSSRGSFESVTTRLWEGDPFMQAAIIETFGKSGNVDFLLEFSKSANTEVRLASLLSLRKSGTEVAKQVIPTFLSDQSPIARITVLKWIAEDNLGDYRDDVEKSFTEAEDLSQELFDAYVVTFQYLDGKFDSDSHFMEGDEHVRRTFYKRQKFLLATVNNKRFNYKIRARALSSINPAHAELGIETLKKYANEPNAGLQIEAVRTISTRVEDTAAIRLLQKIVVDTQRNINVRQEVIVGLSNTVSTDEESKKILQDILQKEIKNQMIKDEISRSLERFSTDPKIGPYIKEYRTSLPSDDERSSMDFWRSIGKEKGDEIAGARTFFSNRYLCSTCHRVNGRGGIFGPDLSKVGGNSDRNRIIESILNPDDIISPAYSGYVVASTSGDVFVGRLDKDLDSKRHLQMILANGERARVPYDEIKEQKILPNSLMPTALHQRMSATEFRDLIEFLAQSQ